MAAGRGGISRSCSLPVISVTVLMAFFYYTTVFLLLDEIGSHRVRLHAAAFSFLAIMCFCSFAAAVLTDPGGVPSSFVPDVEELPKRNRFQPKFCDKCNNYKPSRAHHCRNCKRCILKMDHHCVWINNCVGYRNYKSFIIFVLYATCASIYSMVIFIWGIIQKDRDFTEKLPLGFFYMGSGLIATLLSIVLGTLSGWHIYLISHNMTTIEYRGAVRAMWLARKSGQPYHHPFDVGLYRNLSTIFGSNLLKWVCPWAIGDLKDGTHFPVYHEGSNIP